jgi:hypothetical protein
MTMPTLTGSSPISALELPKALTDRFTRSDMRKVSALTAHTYEYYVGSGLSPKHLAALEAAFAKFNLTFARDGGNPNTCKLCPACPECGNPRAQDARHVTTDYRSRYKHNGFQDTPGCDGCNQYHRDLWAAAQQAAA